VPGNGDFDKPQTSQRPGGAGGAGGDGGAGGGAGGGGTGGSAGFGGTGGVSSSILCVDLPAEGNVFLPVFNDTVGAFEPAVVFSAWLPDRCDPFRQLSLGFNDSLCSTDRGQSFQVVIPDDETARIIPGRPYDIRPLAPASLAMSIRLQDGNRVWGNCEDSTGTLTFRDFGMLPGEDIQLILNATLTDCSALRDGSTVSVAGTELAIVAPLGCLR
jgi:hypothetical protein